MDTNSNDSSPKQPGENPLMRPDHELPAPHDMLLNPANQDAGLLESPHQNEGAVPPPENSSGTPPNTKRSFPMWVFPVLALLIVLMAGGVYLLGQQKPATQPVSPKKIITTPPTATPNPDPTANWMTYDNGLFMFKYPENYTIISSSSSKIVWKNTDPTASISSTMELFSQGGKFPIPKVGAKMYLLPNNIIDGMDPPGNPLLENVPAVDYRLSCGMNCIYAELYFTLDNKNYLLRKFAKGENLESDYNIGITTFKFHSSSLMPSSSPSPSTSEADDVTMCTMDAKICADGSSVGRSGPKCEFAACPK